MGAQPLRADLSELASPFQRYRAVAEIGLADLSGTRLACRYLERRDPPGLPRPDRTSVDCLLGLGGYLEAPANLVDREVR